MFLVEDMLKRSDILRPETEERILRILKIMEDIESKQVDAQDRLAVEALDTIKIRRDETDALEAEYRRWGYRLAENCGVPIYKHSRRYQLGGANYAGNIPVVH
jgi:hypothetical protein